MGNMFFYIMMFFTNFLPLTLTIVYIIFYIIVLLKRKLIEPFSEMRKTRIEEIEYYREELDRYSPMINAKILGKDIFDSDVITSMILYLEDKGWDGNTEITEENRTFLKHEKLFIERSKMIFLFLQNRRENKKELKLLKYYMEESIEKDMIEIGLLKSEYIKRKDSIKKEDILTWVLFMINILFICKIIELLDTIELDNQGVIKIAQIIQLIVNFLWMGLYFVDANFKIYFISYLNEEGKIYAEKLRASKRYLKNYTLISEKEIKSKIIFKSYLRNAIFFNLKGSLDKEAKHYYMDKISKYGYLERRKQNWILNIVSFILLYGMWIFLFIVGDFSFKLLLANWLIYPLIFLAFMKKIYPENVKDK